MLNLTYKSDKKSYQVEYHQSQPNIARIIGNFPAKDGGFTLSPDGKKKWDYSMYSTIYRQGDGFVEFSSDGSVYVEPVVEPQEEEEAPPSVSLEDLEMAIVELSEVVYSLEERMM